MSMLDQVLHRGQDAARVISHDRGAMFPGANELQRMSGGSHLL